MQLVAENLSCPLCKRPLAADSTSGGPGSRLCESCQAMIHGALRVRGAGEKTGVAVIAPSETTAVVEEATALDEPHFEFYEGPADDHSFDAPSATMLDFSDDPQRATPGSEILDHHSMTGAPSEQMTDSLPELVGDESVKSGDHLRHEDNDTIQVDSIDADGAVADDPSQNWTDANREEQDPAQASLDPWENPLPEWEYSKNEWPVLVGPGRHNHKKKFPVVIAAVLAGAIIVIIAGAYFITHRSNAVATSSAAAEHVAAPSDAPEASEAIVVPSPQSQASEQSTQSLNNARSATVETKPASEVDNSSGRFSLQAAAFPNQDGAAEFADKLKRAGVPSYVVVADIPKRGRWYRVRVGRFNTAAEAQRFASEAQTRAGAAGLSLQLIGCEYERPE